MLHVGPPVGILLDHLEQSHKEAERLFTLQREATERLLVEQRKALAEHYRVWEEWRQLRKVGLVGEPSRPGPEGNSLRRLTLSESKVEEGLRRQRLAEEAEAKRPLMGMRPLCSCMPVSMSMSLTLSEGVSDSSDSESGCQGHPLGIGNVIGMVAGVGKSTSQPVLPHNRLQACLLPVLQNQNTKSFIGVLVLLNTICFGWQTHRHIRKTLHSEIHSARIDEVLHSVEHCFLSIFGLEIVLRILAEQGDFFVGPNWKWNAFDSILLGFCTVGGSIAYLRAVRLLRAARIIRVFRFLRHLRLMLFSILSCFQSLLWALGLLLLVIFVFSLYLGEVILFYGDMHEVDPYDPIFESLLMYWDGIPEAMRTLVFSISGGENWAILSRPFWEISVVHGICYTFFILFTMFGLLNIIVGVFVQESAGILKWDRELVLEDELDKKRMRESQLQELFQELDKDASGFITLEELSDGLEEGHVRAFFAHLNVDITNAMDFFRFLDRSQSGFVDMADFVNGCVRFQGSAKPMEVAGLLSEVKSLTHKVDSILASRSPGEAPESGGQPSLST